MLRDGSLEVQNSNDKKPELVKAGEVLADMAHNFQMASSYSKPDFFVPIPIVEGMASAESMAKAGVMVHCLDSRLVYP